MDASAAVLIDFLREVFHDIPPHHLIPLTGDGSDRQFFRLLLPARTYVLMYASGDTPSRLRENLAFQYFSAHLERCGIPVPHLYHTDVTRGLFLMEDLGDVTLQRVAGRSRSMRRGAYRAAVELLARIHRSAHHDLYDTPFLDGPSYDPPFVLEKELEYFRQSFLCDFLSLPVRWNDVRDDFSSLAERAGTRETYSIIHRDFQSRNLMITNGKLYVIDYQGMRYGPPEYDLASLLIDPYVSLPPREQHMLIRMYAHLTHRFSLSRYHAVLLCRNLQILAAFAFLGCKKRKQMFLRYIPRAWQRLRENVLLRESSSLSRLRTCLQRAHEKMMDKGYKALV